jgi:hypothetical protein
MKRGPLAITIFVTATALASATGSLAEPPALTLGRRGLSLSRLPPILSEPTVAQHLDTGLTTVFLFEVERRGPMPLQGAAQVRIRYDLWDERYRLERADAAGEASPSSVSRTELASWWQALVLSMIPANAAPPLAAAGQARVRLQVLPFSQAEQRDAQDWLLRSLRSAEPPPPAPPPGDRSAAAGSAARAPVRDFYGAMLASSIGRRSLLTYHWTVPIVEQR